MRSLISILLININNAAWAASGVWHPEEKYAIIVFLQGAVYFFAVTSQLYKVAIAIAPEQENNAGFVHRFSGNMYCNF